MIEHKVGSFKLGEEISKPRDELDPSRPEPGTVVWWRYPHLSTWEIAKVHHAGTSLPGIYNLYGDFVSMDDVQWKPARILASDEVAVNVPPVREWPNDSDELYFRFSWYYSWYNGPSTYAGVTITRAEAERMDAER